MGHVISRASAGTAPLNNISAKEIHTSMAPAVGDRAGFKGDIVFARGLTPCRP